MTEQEEFEFRLRLERERASPPAAVQAGTALRDVPRQVGLTARYALEGPAQALSIFTEPIRQYITDPLVRLATGKTGSSQSINQMATGAADAIGLPAPQTANERVVGDIARTMAGAGGTGSGGCWACDNEATAESQRATIRRMMSRELEL